MMRVQVSLAKQVNLSSSTFREFRSAKSLFYRCLRSSEYSPSKPIQQIAPYFVLMLNDTIALEHEKVSIVELLISLKYIVQVEFKVKVLGTPKPSLQWFKDDLEVGTNFIEVRNTQLLLPGFQQRPSGDQGRGGWRKRDRPRSEVYLISNIS